MSERKIIGIDPDTKILSLCLIGHEISPLVACTKVRGPTNWALAAEGINDLVYGNREIFRGAEAYIEDQYISRHSKAKPQDLLMLSRVAGMWFIALATIGVECTFVLPARWKNNQPKRINQPRVYARLGLEYETKGGQDPYPVPLDRRAITFPGTPVPNKGDFKDINDSIGIALWASQIKER